MLSSHLRVRSGSFFITIIIYAQGREKEDEEEKDEGKKWKYYLNIFLIIYTHKNVYQKSMNFIFEWI